MVTGLRKKEIRGRKGRKIEKGKEKDHKEVKDKGKQKKRRESRGK